MRAQGRAADGTVGGRITLIEVSADNWRAVAAVRPRPEQERFVAPITYYLCLCHYGQVWHPLAVLEDGVVVGYVMWGIDASRWIGGFVIDAAAQGRGIGRATLETLIARLAADPDCREVALSYHPDNAAARQLYASLGFIETGERDDDELVARRGMR